MSRRKILKATRERESDLIVEGKRRAKRLKMMQVLLQLKRRKGETLVKVHLKGTTEKKPVDDTLPVLIQMIQESFIQ